MSGLKQKHAAKGVGNLLDEDELGQLEVKFKKPKSNASMKTDPQLSEITDGLSSTLDLGPLHFSDTEGSQIVSVTPQLGARAAWGQLH